MDQDKSEPVSKWDTQEDYEGFDRKRSSSRPHNEKSPRKKYMSKYMRLYPELYRSDVSIHPSYTELKNLPYHVVCRRRIQRLKKQMVKQINKEIMHFAMMQMFAIDSVRIDRVFSVGISPKATVVPDFATEKERQRINDLLRDT